MTRKISLITAVAGAALVLGVPAAWGKSQPVVASPDAVERAVANHQESSTVITSPDAFERAVAAKLALQSTVLRHSDSVEGALAQTTAPVRTTALRHSDSVEGALAQTTAPVRTTALRHSDSVDGALDRAAAVKQGDVQWLRALEARSDGLNRIYGLGKYARSWETTSKPQAIDARSDALNRMYGLGEYSSVSATNSKGDFEWPQVGIAFGIGIVLVLGLILGLKATRNPPLAH